MDEIETTEAGPEDPVATDQDSPEYLANRAEGADDDGEPTESEWDAEGGSES